MGIRNNLSGKAFNDLKVLGYSHTKNGNAIWQCLCKCGNNTQVKSINLTKNLTKSCGCRKNKYGHKNPLYKGVADLSGGRWAKIVHHAKERGLLMNISVDEGWSIFIKQNKKCALTGMSICFGSKSNKIETTASLDRIDSSKGYIKKNVQWVHKRVNILKGNLPQKDLLKWCNKIVKHSKNLLKSRK